MLRNITYRGRPPRARATTTSASAGAERQRERQFAAFGRQTIDLAIAERDDLCPASPATFFDSKSSHVRLRCVAAWRAQPSRLAWPRARSHES
jgi:hypothetical protein